MPSISVSDPRFKNVEGNNWSGPSEGLTFQRAIRALGSYGHHAEVVMLGALQAGSLSKEGRFPQQIDPLTSIPDPGDGYGPMILSLLEYSALTTGVTLEEYGILFSSIAVTGGTSGVAPAFSFTLTLGSTFFTAAGFGNGTFTGTRNGSVLFSCTPGFHSNP